MKKEELEKIIRLGDQNANRLNVERERFLLAKSKKDAAFKALAEKYFKGLVEELSGQRYSGLLRAETFRILDSKLTRHEEYDFDWEDFDKNWRIRDFGFYGLNETGPTLLERYPSIRKQLKDLAEICAPKASLSIQSRYGCWPWREFGSTSSGKEMIDLIKNEKLSSPETTKGAVRLELIDLLTTTVNFGPESEKHSASSGEHKFRIIDKTTNEQLCPNKEFIQEIGELKNWYEACRKEIGNPLKIIVKENAKKGYRSNLPGIGRDADWSFY